jgi:hypothetical protein
VAYGIAFPFRYLTYTSNLAVATVNQTAAAIPREIRSFASSTTPHPALIPHETAASSRT